MRARLTVLLVLVAVGLLSAQQAAGCLSVTVHGAV